MALFSHFDSDGEMWAGKGERSIRHRVQFNIEFMKSPIVQIAITFMDADSNQHLRYMLIADNVSKNNFDIVFKTWSDSRFARVWVNWTAIGEKRDPQMWDV